MTIELSHTIDDSISVYPGVAPPQLEFTSTVPVDGFAEMKLVLNSHSGTHVDAPCHMIDGGKTLDQFDPGKFIGPATVIDCRDTGKEIPLALLLSHRQQISTTDFVLFCTGRSKNWKTPEYIDSYPALSEDAALWLSHFPIKGIGLDTISPDPLDSTHYPVHQILLQKELLIIENLTNLEMLIGRDFLFICLPLKIRGSDAAPARAIAQLTQ